MCLQRYTAKQKFLMWYVCDYFFLLVPSDFPLFSYLSLLPTTHNSAPHSTTAWHVSSCPFLHIVYLDVYIHTHVRT